MRNTGARRGSTVVQCYVEPPPGDGARPPRTLRAFAKVEVEAGATARVRIALHARDFAVWDEAGHGWVVPRGVHGVRLGTSSRDLLDAIAVTAP